MWEHPRMIMHIRNNIHVVTASYSLDEVHDAEGMDAQLEAVVGRGADARGVAVTTHQRDLSWDCNSEAEALSLSQKLQQVTNGMVEITEIKD